MAELARLKQNRGTIKATLTNIKKFADEKVSEPPERQVINREQIETRLEKLEKAWTEFHDVNDSIAVLSNASQQVDIDIFEDSFYETEAILKRLLRARLPSLTPKPDDNASFNRKFSHDDTIGVHSDIRLPRIQMESFIGDYSTCPSFHDQYLKAIHNNASLSNVTRFQHLKTLLQGEAAELVRHLPITEAGYIEAWEKLMKRYDRKKNIIKDYIDLFINQAPVQSSSSLKNLRSLCDVSDQVLRGIRALGTEWEDRDPWLLQILLKKLDIETQQLWAIQSNDNKKPTINELITFLSERCEAMECTSIKRSANNNSRQSTIKIHATTSYNAPFNTCHMCKGRHPLYRCYKFKGLKPPARKQIIVNNKLCENCLRAGHEVFNCESERNCMICAEKHNTLLHISDNIIKNRTLVSAQSMESTLNSSTDTFKNHYLPINSSVESATSKNSAVRLLSELDLQTCQEDNTLSHQEVNKSKNKQENCSLSYVCEDWLSQALLSTVQLRILDETDTVQQVRALLDSGSQSTLITESLAQRLKLRRYPASCVISGLAAKPTISARGSMKLQLTSIYSNAKILNVDALILPKLTTQIPSSQINKSRWEVINDLKLADPNFAIPGHIDMILGNDVFLDTLLPERFVIQPNVIAQHTIFGWVIGGKLTKSASTNMVQTFHITTTTNSEELKLLEKFWQLEEICVDRPARLEDEKCEEYFKATTHRSENGRFSVRLPFKEATSVLGSSHINAERRLLSQERKFCRQPELAQQYRNFMSEYIALGHMECISKDDIDFNKPYFYLPHHAVWKDTSTTTKLRVVFDGSCKSSSSASINDILLAGPTIQDNLTTILLRFRIPCIGISADIEKMYRQVNVQEQDCNFQRILWRDDLHKLYEHYRLKTVTYGITSAPFLAIRTMIELANIYELKYPKAAPIVKRDFYVDDMLTGCEDVTTAISIYEQISQLLQEGGFNIRKWISNNQELLNAIPANERGTHESISLDDDTTYYKTLGLYWNPTRDCFCYKVKLYENTKFSKRTLLSEASRVYDPLGLITPITITFKILFQEVWKRKIDWDQELPTDIAEQWQ